MVQPKLLPLPVPVQSEGNGDGLGVTGIVIGTPALGAPAGPFPAPPLLVALPLAPPLLGPPPAPLPSLGSNSARPPQAGSARKIIAPEPTIIRKPPIPGSVLDR